MEAEAPGRRPSSSRPARRRARRGGRPGAPASRSRTVSCSSVSRASPTRPWVPGWLRPISSASMSIWITCCAAWNGTVASRVPTARTTSARSRWRRTGEPGQSAAPSERSLASLMRALALGGHDNGGLEVLRDGMERLVGAREIDPPPATMTSCRAAVRRAAARSISAATPAGADRRRIEERHLALVLEGLGRDVDDDRARTPRPELARSPRGRVRDLGTWSTRLRHFVTGATASSCSLTS